MSQNQLAFVFPGQGSQKVGMLANAAANYSEVTQTFAQASEVLGYDLWDLVQTGPQDALNLTEKTQPLLLTASVALWRVWCANGGVKPSLLAGHSLGEFSALVCSEVISFESAVDLVKQRGQFMQSAVPVGVGAMAAIIGLDDASIIAICDKLSGREVVQAVNFNSPGQVVIAGHAEAVTQAMAACKEAGAKRALPLPVSAPFHTSLMQPAGDKLAEVLAGIEFSTPHIPIIHNVNALPESNPERIRQLMVEQIYSPVQWTNCIEYMVAQGVETTIECGPGKVLSGLSRRIHKPLAVHALEEPEAIVSALNAL